MKIVVWGGGILDNNRKEPKRRIKIIFIGIIAGLLILVGTSYAWWTTTATQTGINEVQSGCLKLSLTEEKNDIRLEKTYPIEDKDAKNLTPYQFKITNICKTTVDYTVKLEKLMEKNGQEDNLLNSEYIAVEFNGGQKELLFNYPKGKSTYEGEDYKSVEARELIKGTLNESDTKTYTIKLWMDESVTIEDQAMNKIFISKIVVDGSMNDLAVYNEPKLHGADPVLGNQDSKGEIALLSTNTLAEVEPTPNDKLIPVIISDNGTVTRADLSHDWYNYEEKRWANAVILTDGAEEPDVGATIEEKDIESYFVWIPKYSYKLFDDKLGEYTEALPASSELSNKGPTTSIEIRFGIEDTDDGNPNECTTPTESGERGSCGYGDWMTHPAFLAFEGAKGLWVGKFETGYKGATKVEDAQKNENKSEQVIIKPNVYSWRNINVSNAYQTSYGYKRELESHMMKNTEWGAVAYLTNSIYGRCNNGKCTEVNVNNSQNYVTGVVAINGADTGFSKDEYATTTPKESNNVSYVYPTSQKASTTENNTGIFDMSGGSWEYVAGVMLQEGNKEVDYGSGGKIDFADSKYYDSYQYWADQTHWNRRILGDAIGEIGPIGTNVGGGWHWSYFYQDYAVFVYTTHPWLCRGGQFQNTIRRGEDGIARGNCSFRIVLAI